MKRISIFTIVVLILLPGLSSARSRYYGISVRFRTRYSPYAFGHKYRTGLISGELQYSPYAAGHNRSGLVPYWYRYSPYAFSHRHPSGLISDFGSYYYFPYGDYPYVNSYAYSGSVNCGYTSSHCPSVRKNNYAKRINPHSNGINIAGERDGKEIIYNYLKGKNIDGFQVDRIFSVNNETVSVNFVLRDKNLIIKYWNPEHAKALMKQSGYKRNYYEKYKQNWKELAQKHQQAGGKIYQIESTNAKEILSRLSLCPELSEG